MFVLSDSNANRAYGASRGFQLRAFKAASKADACSSVSLQVWMVSGFTAKNHNHKDTKDTKVLVNVQNRWGERPREPSSKNFAPTAARR